MGVVNRSDLNSVEENCTYECVSGDPSGEFLGVCTSCVIQVFSGHADCAARKREHRIMSLI